MEVYISVSIYCCINMYCRALRYTIHSINTFIVFYSVRPCVHRSHGASGQYAVNTAGAVDDSVMPPTNLCVPILNYAHQTKLKKKLVTLTNVLLRMTMVSVSYTLLVKSIYKLC